MKDYYEILGVSKNAGQDEIKAAFRKLAHQHHPDKGGGNAEKFKEINEAYQALGNPEKRRQYDQFGSTFSQNSGFSYQDFARAQGTNPFSQGFDFRNFSGRGGSASGWDFGDLGDLGDLFGSVFSGGGGRRQRAVRGSDVEIELTIDFEESIFGVEKNIDLQKQVLCDYCSGNGAEPGSKIFDCPACGGRGEVSRVEQTILGAFQTRSICPDCQGEGKKYEKKCGHCRGNGIVYGSEKIKVKIPAGIEDGQSIKLGGKGEPAPAGRSGAGRAGDLYITLKIKPDKKFKRKGNDIFSQEHISLRQAILGDKIQTDTVDGPVSLKIPPGAQSHTQFRLRDKGVPYLRRRGRGDQIVEVIVDIPASSDLSRNQRRIVEEWDF